MNPNLRKEKTMSDDVYERLIDNLMRIGGAVVEVAVQICKLASRSVASPAEAREILKLKPR